MARCPFTERTNCCQNTLCANRLERDAAVLAELRAAREREDILAAAQASGRLMIVTVS